MWVGISVMAVKEFQTETDKIQSIFQSNKHPQRIFDTMPRMLCNGNGVFSLSQMGVAVMGFVEDFRYGLHNSKK